MSGTWLVEQPSLSMLRFHPRVMMVFSHLREPRFQFNWLLFFLGIVLWLTGCSSQTMVPMNVWSQKSKLHMGIQPFLKRIQYLKEHVETMFQTLLFFLFGVANLVWVAWFDPSWSWYFLYIHACMHALIKIIMLNLVQGCQTCWDLSHMANMKPLFWDFLCWRNSIQLDFDSNGHTCALIGWSHTWV